MTRPTHATVVAYLALGVALGGTGYAATGGNFILGRSNTAGATSSLANAYGTPLSLSAASGYAPLRVNSSTKVVSLNADLIDGKDSTAFLGVATTIVTGYGYNASASCPYGYVVVGGGGSADYNDSWLKSSEPYGNGWRTTAYRYYPGNYAYYGVTTSKAYALCARKG